MWVAFGKNSVYKALSDLYYMKGARTLIQSYVSSAPSGLQPLVLLSVQFQQRVELQQQRDSQQQQLLQLVCGVGRVGTRK